MRKRYPYLLAWSTRRNERIPHRGEGDGPGFLATIRIGLSRLWDRAAGVSLIGVILIGWNANWPAWCMVCICLAGLVLLLPSVRLPLRRRRDRRVRMRYWNGRSGYESPAAAIGLVRAGRFPRMATYSFRPDGFGRDIDFVLPAGIVMANVEAVLPHLIDHFGAVSGTVKRSGPGVVRLVLMDCDPLAATRAPGWAPESQSSEADSSPAENSRPGTPWWAQQASPETDGEGAE